MSDGTYTMSVGGDDSAFFEETFMGGFTGGGLADSFDRGALAVGTALVGPANPNAARWLGITIVFLVIVIGLEIMGVLSCGPAHMIGFVKEGISSQTSGGQTVIDHPGVAGTGYASSAYCSQNPNSSLCEGAAESFYEGMDDDRLEGMDDSRLEGISGAPVLSEEFVNSREAPYFSDVTNRVLRMENREKEAIRALSKINQERLRRQAERPDATVPWKDHWSDWKRANPLGEEQMF